MAKQAREIRIALPSKGLLAQGSKELLKKVGLAVYNPNPRQYQAEIPSLPGVAVIFQRPGDIVVSIRDGSIDFGITGRDVFLEKQGANGSILELHSALGFGSCTLNVITPESWEKINHFKQLESYQRQVDRPLRIATKFPNLTHSFFADNGALAIDIIRAEGALEIAPTVGYADLIVDLVSTGTTLRDNRLKILAGGEVIRSQACLIANLDRLKKSPETLAIATQLLELIGAHLRANENLAIFANVRGDSAESIAELIFQNETISGLQGPTISRLITKEREKWHAIHLIVRKNQLHQAIKEIRGIGGSGVVVSPVSYIFEEEPDEVTNLLAALEV
ncbi:MAG: ATP phosphoribosyltransferase [Anaerolineaceae bacterium]|nr:MAG: ATP phosphoribosyltransferase [Anaerolineaceae bacterium]